MSSDYFVNHPRAMRFPWSIYHRPLEESLARFLQELARAVATPRVLVVGGGYLHELRLVPASVRLTVVDIDPRVIDQLGKRSDPRIERCLTVTESSDLAALGLFDGIYGKEVIEHIPDAERYLTSIAGLLSPGGRVWISTPNYGDFLLPFLESTILELIGRMSGYSRKDIHPTRFSRDRLVSALRAAGLSTVEVTKTPFRLALVGTGQRTNRWPAFPARQ
jgi:2-polyprenyl-3-methyl-5-hydroxy-6-metoxy-1,4-benzoquinol methylase